MFRRRHVLRSFHGLRRFTSGSNGSELPAFVSHLSPEAWEQMQSTHVNWFPGHMATSLKKLDPLMKACHLILEVRDARIPFSSTNFLLDDMMAKRQKNRLILLNKADLCDPKSKKAIKARFDAQGQPFLFTEGLKPHKFNELIKMIPSLSTQKYKSLPSVCLIVGFPNTGKSTIINALRQVSVKLTRGTTDEIQNSSVARTGAMPGLTRAIAGFKVSVDPPIRVMDTPGVMMPASYMSSHRDIPASVGIEIGLRLGLVGCVKDSLIGTEELARYLLHVLNGQNKLGYLNVFGLPGTKRIDDFEQVIKRVEYTARNGKKSYRGLTPDGFRRMACEYFLDQFRRGHLGAVSIDTTSSIII